MKFKVLTLVLLGWIGILRAQTGRDTATSFSHYLEDQLFFNLSYVALRQMPPGLVQQGFSHSVSYGFIRDIPVNLRRNFGFGVGVGYERTTLYQNLRVWVSEADGQVRFRVMDPQSYLNNAFVIKKLVFPLEIRYRNSTPEKLRFFRLYAGVMPAYTLGAESHFENDQLSVVYRKLKNLPARWNWGTYLYIGYGELNGYIYYGLNDLFSPQVLIDGKHYPVYDLRFGVMLSFL